MNPTKVAQFLALPLSSRWEVLAVPLAFAISYLLFSCGTRIAKPSTIIGIDTYHAKSWYMHLSHFW